MPSWSQKIESRTFPAGFGTRIFLGAGWAAMLPLHWLLLCLRVIVILLVFVHGHQSRQAAIWIAPKNFQKLLRRLAPLTFLIRVQAIRDPLRGELPHVHIFVNDRPTPLTWDAQLLSYWFWSVISGVVTVLGRPGRGASQVEKSPRLNWGTHLLTVAYSGACSHNVSVRMAWISFGALPCRGGDLNDSLCLYDEITRIAWHASFQPL